MHKTSNPCPPPLFRLAAAIARGPTMQAGPMSKAVPFLERPAKLDGTAPGNHISFLFFQPLPRNKTLQEPLVMYHLWSA